MHALAPWQPLALAVSCVVLFSSSGPRADEVSASEIEQEDREALEAIGYLSGSQVWTGATGVTRHDPARAQDGLNFYTSGHAASAVLMDMSGNVLHRWEYDWKKIFRPGGGSSQDRNHWRRAVLLPDGSVIAIFEGEALLRVDANSRLVWKQRLRAHHAAQLMPNDELYVLTREFHVLPRLNANRKVFEDFISVLDIATGKTKRKYSLIEAMENSDYRHFVDDLEQPIKGDLFHTNSLEVLDGRLAGVNQAFRANNVLTSALELDAIFVVDLEKKSVVWARTGSWREQHEPRALDDGRILLFDNRGSGKEHSRILEIEVEGGREEVVYGGSEKARFYSKRSGTAARLPNGNTLIAESEQGRSFEITPSGDIVWEFINPEFVDSGKGQEVIAHLFDLVRIPRGSSPWLLELELESAKQAR